MLLLVVEPPILFNKVSNEVTHNDSSDFISALGRLFDLLGDNGLDDDCDDMNANSFDPTSYP